MADCSAFLATEDGSVVAIKAAAPAPAARTPPVRAEGAVVDPAPAAGAVGGGAMV